MDKYEYKVRADEIKALIAEGDFAEAVKIADTIDWRRVKSVMMLCSVSDLYKINRRYQESKDILLLAYEKHPTGRLIVYSLCELSIKMEEYVQAIEYYKEFVQIAPRDTGRYILQYRLYEAQDVSLEERIAVLEEFKKRDYREKWAYELAYLYHRIGLTTKCVEECDEMYLWFGEGKFVLKALELKALHTPLNAEQQAKYDSWIMARNAEVEEEEEEPDEAEEDDEDYERDDDDEDEEEYDRDEEIEDEEDFPEEDEDDGEDEDEDDEDEEEEEDDEDEIMSIPTAELPQVKTVDVGQYNTLNLQMALAESMRELLIEEEDEAEKAQAQAELLAAKPKTPESQPPKSRIIEMPQSFQARQEQEPLNTEFPDIRDQEETETSPITEQIIAPLLQETAEMPKVTLQGTDELQEIVAEDIEEPEQEAIKAEPAGTRIQEPVKPEPPKAEPVRIEQPEPIEPETAMEQVKEASNTGVSSVRYDDVLSQENDGQIRLVVPDIKAIEKQITGQLSIEDIMAEWEAMKKSNEQKRKEAVRQRILEHTGSLFADFDEATKSGLLEQLEKAFVAAIMKESGKQPGIKQVVLPVEAEKELSEKPVQAAPKKPEPVETVAVEEEQPAQAEKRVEKKPKKTKKKAATLPKPEPEIPEEIDKAEETLSVEEEEMPAAEEPDVDGDIKEADEDELTGRAGKAGKEEVMEEKAEPQPAKAALQTGRELTDEEKALFGQYVHHKKSREQLIHTLDNMSLAAYTGNVIITGEEGSGTLSLAKGLIKEMQYNDGNFSGKVAKIFGAVLNKKDIAETLARINNGALIIEKAADLKEETVVKLAKSLEKDNIGLLLILEDTKQRMNRLLVENSILNYSFELRIDIEPLDDEALVAYAKQYAEQMEYSIDEFGVLALHTRIADMQTSDHEVTVAEVRELVDEAIYYANKKTPKHFVDILLAKRYDNDDMIILREQDFMHY